MANQTLAYPGDLHDWLGADAMSTGEDFEIEPFYVFFSSNYTWNREGENAKACNKGYNFYESFFAHMNLL